MKISITLKSLLLVLLLATVACVPVSAVEPVQADGGTKLLKIGAPISLSGRFEALGTQSLQGYETWAKWANENGGIQFKNQTYTVELIALDDQSDAAIAAQLTEDLIKDHKVDFLLGPYSSGITAAASEVSEGRKQVMVEGNGASESLFDRGFEYLFGVMTPAGNFMQSGLEAYSQAGAQTAVIVVEDATFPKSVADGAQEWAAQYGIQILAVETYPTGTTDFAAQFTALKAMNPDLLLGGSRLTDAVAFVQNAKAVDWNLGGMLLLVGPSNPSFVDQLGADAEYVLGPTQWQASSANSGPYFGSAADYAARFEADHGVAPIYQAAASTAAALALHLGIEQAESRNPKKVADALRAMDAPDTFWGRITFDDTGKNADKPMLTTQVQGGQILTVAPSGSAEAALIYPMPAWGDR